MPVKFELDAGSVSCARTAVVKHKIEQMIAKIELILNIIFIASDFLLPERLIPVHLLTRKQMRKSVRRNLKARIFARAFKFKNFKKNHFFQLYSKPLQLAFRR
jgi:hypothetical protein